MQKKNAKKTMIANIAIKFHPCGAMEEGILKAQTTMGNRTHNT
jgi:hypothetical protein